MSQSEEMFKWAGDNWLRRNKKDMGKEDPVWPMLPDDIKPDHRILEIGCANGWRLKKLKEQYHCTVCGIDPSEAAVAEANIRNKIDVVRGIASNMPLWWSNEFNIVIMGFCLWLIEPLEWFKVVAESDRVLKDGGLLIIHDFAAVRPFRSSYNYDDEAKAGSLWTYHFNWVRLWTTHPAYTILTERVVRVPAYEIVSVLRKNMNCIATAELPK